MSKETIIAGDEKTEFLYKNRMDYGNPFAMAIALVFAKDREKPHGSSLFLYLFTISFSLVTETDDLAYSLIICHVIIRHDFYMC